MRVFYLIIGVALASGCSSYGVHCDHHLQPINSFQLRGGEVGPGAGEPESP
jgi:hypothetical protein